MRAGRKRETDRLCARATGYLTMEEKLDLLFWARDHGMTESRAVRHMIVSALHRDGAEMKA
jgi:hypothetical protein